MCKGSTTHRQGENCSVFSQSVSCELCNSSASLYCQADNAFLCRKCDKWVHGANFLAQRHLRCFLCSTCRGLTNRYLAGSSSEMVLPTAVKLGENDNNNPSTTTQTRCNRGALKKPFLSL
ncbi:B-box domain protein 31 [Impatiens glandulifera]|uniref:B-box domain protein 31 n=1 Tax=Impatiens glandulifera TaxID=253017 RepID=UPI001FB1872C|nr:B-box domain protein 31 [Impatiens glandulifera]